MAITHELIRKLREKTAAGPFIFLVELFDKDNTIIRHVTNYNTDIVAFGNTYFQFPFVVSIPEFSQEIGQSIQLTFANFSVGSYSGIKDDLKRVAKAVFKFISVDNPTEEIFPESVYFHTTQDAYHLEATNIRLSFSRRIFDDKKVSFQEI